MSQELNFQGVFLPPFLIVLILSVTGTMLTAMVLNRFRLARFFAAPRLVFMAFICIYVVLIGTFLIRI